MFNIMQELHINAKRMDALLNVPQEEKLRTFFKNKAKARHQRISNARRPPPPPTPLRPTLREFPKTCNCCDRRWIHKAEEDGPTPLCDQCLGHNQQQSDEPIERNSNGRKRTLACSGRIAIGLGSTQASPSS